MEYLKTLVFWEDNWFFNILVTALLGYIIPKTCYAETKEKIEKKLRSLGKKLLSENISWRKAFLESLFETIQYPLVVSLCIFGGFAIAENKHGLEAFFLGLLFSSIPTFYSINDTLKQLREEAKDD